MSISGVSSAASVSSMDMYASSDIPVNVSMAASVQVLDMAQSVFKDAADRLLAEMAALITGLGQNVDIYA